MDGYLRLGILLLATLVLLLIGLEAWIRHRRLKAIKLPVTNQPFQANQRHREEEHCTFRLPPTENHAEHSSQAEKRELQPEDYFLILSVFAKPNANFGSYDLLQAITTTGMQFGEMNIFHYLNEHHRKLFSLASATKPGYFNIDKMGDFSCKGLTLFMDIREVPDPIIAFSAMLETAEQLADDLDGDLYAGPHKPLSNEILQDYQERISLFNNLQNA